MRGGAAGGAQDAVRGPRPGLPSAPRHTHHTHTLTLAHTHTLAHSHTHDRRLTFTHTNTLMLEHTHTHTLTHSLTLTRTLTLTLTLKTLYAVQGQVCLLTLPTSSLLLLLLRTLFKSYHRTVGAPNGCYNKSFHLTVEG